MSSDGSDSRSHNSLLTRVKDSFRSTDLHGICDPKSSLIYLFTDCCLHQFFFYFFETLSSSVKNTENQVVPASGFSLFISHC